MNKITSRIAFSAAFVAALAVSSAWAQQPKAETVRVKGKIESADASSITVKTKDANVKVAVNDKTKVLVIGKGTIADIKKGSYVGVGAMPQADGSQKAIRVMIFAPSQNGIGEGHRPWDKPGTTMTNATVDTTASSVDGEVLTVKYKGGEKKIIIGADAEILLRTDGSHSDLKAGANVDVPAATKNPDGTLETARVDVGRGDYAP
jgi:hypothetical protein